MVEVRDLLPEDEVFEKGRSPCAGATLAVVAPKIGGVKAAGKGVIAVDHALDTGPSIFFDAVAVLLSTSGVQSLMGHPRALDWLRDAYGHCKILAMGSESSPLLKAAGLKPDGGTPVIESARDFGQFVKLASAGRHWDRESK